jgi:type I restriction enzyme R subunit
LKDAGQDPAGHVEEILAKVASDKAYQKCHEDSDKQNARIEHDKALQRVPSNFCLIIPNCSRNSDNAAFKKWLTE